MVCTFISRNWVNDPIVLKTQKYLLEEHGEDHFLPTKQDAARAILDKAEQCHHPDDYAKVMRLYCDVRGFVEKAGITIQNNTQINRPVMLMPPLQSDEEWEKGLVAQQRKLISDSKSTK